MLSPEQYKNNTKIIAYGLEVAFHATTEFNRVLALNEVQTLLTELIQDANQRQQIARDQGFEA